MEADAVCGPRSTRLDLRAASTLTLLQRGDQPDQSGTFSEAGIRVDHLTRIVEGALPFLQFCLRADALEERRCLRWRDQSI